MSTGPCLRTGCSRKPTSTQNSACTPFADFRATGVMHMVGSINCCTCVCMCAVRFERWSC